MLRDLGKLEGWVIANSTKVNKIKFPLGWGNHGYMYRLGDERLDSSPVERDLGFLVNGKLTISQQCNLAAKRAICVLGCINHSIAIQFREMIVPLCSALMQLHLEHCVQFWAPQYKKDIKLSESVQRKAAKMVKGLEGKMYEE